MKDILTKGNVIVNKIKVGDIHYEFEYGVGVKCEVLTIPVTDGNGYWTWRSKNLNTGKDIEYGVMEGMAHYSINIYDYEAYTVKCWV